MKTASPDFPEPETKPSKMLIAIAINMLNRANIQYSVRLARPLKTAYFVST